MPRRKGRNKKKGRRKRPDMARGPPLGATSYTGPISMPVRTRDADTQLARLSIVSVISSSSGGSIAIQYQNVPSSSVEWSNYFNLYEEFRVVAQRVTWQPTRTNFVTTGPILYGPAVYTVDRNAGLSPPTSVSGAFQKSNAVVANIQKPHRSVIRAGTAQEMLFQQVTSPGGTWAWAMTCTGLDPSTVYGVVFVEYLVQFRNRA